MTSTLTSDTASTIDPAYIAAIVRQVLARIRAAQATGQSETTGITQHPRAMKLVTLDAVVRCAASEERVVYIEPRSIVTPAARDEAKRLGVRLQLVAAESTSTSQERSASVAARVSLGMIDTTPASWVESASVALARRGISITPGYAAIQIVLTDEPAKQTHAYSSRPAHRAAMLSGINQVERFQRELSPDVWVIDKTQLNFPTVVNLVAKIARLAGAVK